MGAVPVIQRLKTPRGAALQADLYDGLPALIVDDLAALTPATLAAESARFEREDDFDLAKAYWPYWLAELTELAYTRGRAEIFPFRRPSPRNIHVVAAAPPRAGAPPRPAGASRKKPYFDRRRLHGISTSWLRRRRDPASAEASARTLAGTRPTKPRSNRTSSTGTILGDGF